MTGYWIWLASLTLAFIGPLRCAAAANAPSITTQPQSQSALAGSNAFFTVVATGQSPLFFQWQLNLSDLTNNARISGATNATLTISNVLGSDAGNYQVIVSNSHGSVTSSNATLAVLFPPAITLQPTNSAVLLNADVIFNAAASGTSPISYQWLCNRAPLADGGRVSGSGTPSLSIANVQTNDTGAYQLVASSPYGSATSLVGSLTVLVPAYIAVQPSNQVVMLSSTATLGVSAGGTSPLSYQWYFNGAPLMDGGRIGGSMTASLRITNVQTADAGFYQVVVTNNYGVAQSRVVVLGTSSGAPGLVRFVDINSFSPTPPYTDWSTAATNMQDAVDASSDGDFIFVTNGVYTSTGRLTGDGTTNCLVVTNALTLQGVNGPGVTVINGAGVMRCANLSNNAVLVAMTLTNGSAGWGGGAVGGTLNNCWLLGNTIGAAYYSILNNCQLVSNAVIGVGYSTLSNCVISGSSGSGAGGCSLYNCVLQNNTAPGGQGGGANQCTLTNCLLTGNVASSGGGASASTLNNCTLTNNSASWGGGAIASTLNNCLIVGNAAHNHNGDFYAASLGGGVWAGTANNCTIVGNIVVKDENSGGNYYSGGGTYGTALNNCIVQFNLESPYAHDGASNYGGGSLTNCCASPLPAAGSGNFNSDPLLVNFYGGDYHLQTNSSCINAGANALVVGASDLDGNPRIIGLVADVGAYEFRWPSYFTVQPQSQTVNAGQTVLFSAAATGPLPLTYQWLLNGAAIAGATASTLVRTNVQLADDGAYSVLASNATVVISSANAILSVLYPPPVILSGPTNQTVLAGTPVQLSVTFTSQVPATFQWLLDGTNLVDGGDVTGSTDAVLNVSPAQGPDAGNYQVVVMNGFGAATSSVATLTVWVPANIVTQPVDQAVVLSNTASFNAVAAGTAPLSFQWYFNGSALNDGGRVSGSLTPNLTISSVLTNDAGSYQMVVTNAYGAATSQLAGLTVLLPPTIVVQPTNQTVQPGSNVLFTVTATGPAPLTYQWLFNGVDLTDNARITGSATPTLSIQKVQAADNGTYQVLVTNPNGVALSLPALLVVLTPPVITVQPPNLFEPLNGSALLAAGADGAPPLSYQWYFNGIALSDSGRLTGSLTPALAIRNLQNNDQGSYQLVVTNGFGSATSTVASLRVLLTSIAAPSVVNGWGRDDVNEIDLPGDATNMVAVAAGYNHALGLRNDGTVEGWGESYLGATSPPAGLSNVVALAAGDNHSLALRNDGTVTAWGDNYYGEATVPGGLSNVVAIAAGNFFSLALKADGTVAGWGYNANSQLSQAAAANSIIAIAADSVNTSYAMGLKANGTVVEWGLYVQPAPAGLSNVVQIAMGGSHYLALKSDGTVVAWGDNSLGQTNVPSGLSNVLAIAGGWTASAALKADGTVVVWGDAGGPDGVNPFGLTNVSALAAGGGFNLALNDGTPSLSAWPTNQAVYTGMPVSFAAAIVANPLPASIQWQFNGTSIPGAAGSSLSLTNVQLSDAGNYSVVVTNAYGAVKETAFLAVSTSPPTITQQPSNELISASSNATFNVTATGSWPLNYQWQCSGTNIPGATDSTFVLANAQLAQSGLSFDVVVTNAFGSVISSNVLLTVVPALVTVQPQNLTTNGGATVSFTSSVIGQGPFTYQWQFNSTNLAGATNSSLILTNALASQSGAYALAVSNSFGPAVSAAAQLTVVPWITISITPSVITEGAGTLVVFAFNAGGLSPVNYQWTQNGSPWAAGPNPGGALDIINPPMSWAGVYNVTASDSYATVTSSNVTLTIIPLAITGQPQSRGAWIGGTAQLKVAAIGAQPLAYQWRFNGTNLPGATANPLTLTNFQSTQYGSYDVWVSNAYTNLLSSAAMLSPSQVAVWGSGNNGETNLPVGLTNILALSSGPPGIYDCQALRSNGTVLTWPSNWPSIFLAPATNVVALCGGDPSFGLRTNGLVVEWPAETTGVIPGLSNVVAISSWSGSYLALRNNGTVASNPTGPGVPAGVSNIVAVAQGGGHALALRRDGVVRAWGNNTAGQATVPSWLSNVVGIAAGGYHSLAVRADGTVVGWGMNNYGQTNVPTGLSNVVALAAGLYHSMALKADGTVLAWGLNVSGQTNVPSGLTNVVAIAAGQTLSMALLGNGPPITEAFATNPTLSSNGFSLLLSSQSGRVYALEYKNSVSDTNWIFLPLVAGTGNPLLLIDPTATNSQRYFRVQRW